MKTRFYAVALGAAFLVTGSAVASAQEAGIFATQRDCATDIKSLCAGIQPGGGRILACLQQHVAAGELSVGCSTILSKVVWVARECADDIRQFCPTSTYENVGDCIRPHLGQASATCQSALAYIASPAADRY